MFWPRTERFEGVVPPEHTGEGCADLVKGGEKESKGSVRNGRKGEESKGGEQVRRDGKGKKEVKNGEEEVRRKGKESTQEAETSNRNR